MNQVTIRSVPKTIRIVLDAGPYVLPVDLQAKVNAFWQSYIANKPDFYNGEVFTIHPMQSDDQALVIHMGETNYAHHLYTAKVGDLGEYNTFTIHPTTMVITADDN